MNKFGQRVRIEVYGADASTLVFSAETLRIDFNIKQLLGINRAKFDIWNLNGETVRELTNGKRYVSLYVALHDSDYIKLADKMFVSNAMRETQVPNDITSLYCYDQMREKGTEKQITFSTTNTTLKGIIRAAIIASPEFYEVKFLHFPDRVLDHVPDKPNFLWSGSLERLLLKLGLQYGFKYYLEGKTVKVMYVPSTESLKNSPLRTAGADVIINTDNLRGNPKIGPATIQIVSNLDTRIKPTSVLDVSNLVTATTDQNIDTLGIVKDYLKSVVSGFSKFQCLSAEHMGSNWTGTWETRATAVAPRAGSKMPTASWFGG